VHVADEEKRRLSAREDARQHGAQRTARPCASVRKLKMAELRMRRGGVCPVSHPFPAHEAATPLRRGEKTNAADSGEARTSGLHVDRLHEGLLPGLLHASLQQPYPPPEASSCSNSASSSHVQRQCQGQVLKMNASNLRERRAGADR
jgi:hypothetical protein